MNQPAKSTKNYGLWLLASLLVLGGCKRDNAAPSPLSADQIPPEMRKAFAKAKSETKEIVEKMLTALQSKDYPAAYIDGGAISGAPGITKEQLLVTSRAMLGINELLKNASAQGDQDSTAFIDYQRHNR
jgi:hypothetical protein